MSTAAKDAFALFDRTASGKVSTENLGDLLRAVGHNPTQKEIATLAEPLGESITFDEFQTISSQIKEPSFKTEDYVKAFQIFDKDLTGYIAKGELKYILTSIGEALSVDEVEELLKNVSDVDGKVDYAEFVKSVLA
ncbi:Mlc1 protein [Martiniozyma asiatica (nom. inval.)]|nr:Mlc1 protein [Martiniozyma asiatica]